MEALLVEDQLNIRFIFYPALSYLKKTHKLGIEEYIISTKDSKH
jgi:hypothetical protein